MSRPFKHPQSGIFYLRRRVPNDLIAIIGRREEKVSLKTKDPAEAKRRFSVALAELEARWQNLRIGKKELTELEALEMAREIYDHWFANHHTAPSQQTRWHTDAFSDLWVIGGSSSTSLKDAWSEREMTHLHMKQLSYEAADFLIRKHGIAAEDEVDLNFDPTAR